MVNTRFFEVGMDPYVLQIQCEHVFYYEVPSRAGWLIVVRHDPRGRLVKYNLEEGNEEGLKEEDDVEYNDQHKLYDHVVGEDVR